MFDILVDKNNSSFSNMIFEDKLFKYYLLDYAIILKQHSENLKKFKELGKNLIAKIIAQKLE